MQGYYYRNNDSVEAFCTKCIKINNKVNQQQYFLTINGADWEPWEPMDGDSGYCAICNEYIENAV